MQQNYIASERFIHDELVTRCLQMVEQVPLFWRENKCHIYPTLLLWPSEAIRASGGKEFSGVVFHPLPEDDSGRRDVIAKAAKQCKAYGLLLTEQLTDCVRLIFESEHGTRTWRFPIKNHGGVQVLGYPEFHDNSESIGIRWTAN